MRDLGPPFLFGTMLVLADTPRYGGYMAVPCESSLTPAMPNIGSGCIADRPGKHKARKHPMDLCSRLNRARQDGAVGPFAGMQNLGDPVGRYPETRSIYNQAPLHLPPETPRSRQTHRSCRDPTMASTPFLRATARRLPRKRTWTRALPR